MSGLSLCFLNRDCKALSMLRCLCMFPFTIVMLFIMIAVGIWTRTHRDSLSQLIRRSRGFAPLHLSRGEWTRLFSSVFFTMGGRSFYASVIVLALSVGAAEKVYGTGPAIALFWGIHLATLLIASFLLAIPLHRLRFFRGRLLASARDVGPSAGYYGCLGASAIAIPVRWRVIVIGGIAAILVARLIWSVVTIPDRGRAMSADVAHLLAFPIGLLVGQLVA